MQLVDLRQLVVFLNNDVFECLDLKTNVIINKVAHFVSNTDNSIRFYSGTIDACMHSDASVAPNGDECF